MSKLWKYKGYLIHAAAVVIIFLSPSIQAFAQANPKYAASLVIAYGWLIHWANGK